jgi:hypothetical protein
MRSLGLGCVVLASATLFACSEDMPEADAGTDAGDGGGSARDAGVDAGRVESCEGATDGTPCTGTNMICLADACVESVCGDDFIDAATGEQCEDGNDVAFDGCEPDDCTFTCDTDDDCDDGVVCDGVEDCTAAHVCAEGTPAADGTPCSEGGVTDGVCHPLPAPICQVAECGNRIRDTGEECDDGRNNDATDGCGDDCLIACTGGAAGCTLDVSPDFNDFGSIEESTASAGFTFMVQSVLSGFTDVEPTFRITGADAGEFTIESDTCMGRLASGASCSVTVRFNPSAMGARQAMLVVEGGGTAIGYAELRGFGLGNNGRACEGAGQCASGNCVDDFCCDEDATTCSGCRACNVASSEGTCSNVPAGEDPDGVCTGPCEAGCDGANACRPAPAGTVCLTNACTNSPVTRQFLSRDGIATCDGASTTCDPSRTSSCPNRFACDSSTGQCRTSCGRDLDCQQGSYCSGGACVQGANFGQGCGRDAQCGGTLFCAAGVCHSCRSNRDCGGANGGGSCCVSGSCTSCASCPGSGWGTGEISGGTCGRCTTAADCAWDTGPRCISLGINFGCSCNTGGSSTCSPSRTCIGDRCLTADGNACLTSAECASGTCLNDACL